MTSLEFAAQFVLALHDYHHLHPCDIDAPLVLLDWLEVSARWLEREGITRSAAGRKYAEDTGILDK